VFKVKNSLATLIAIELIVASIAASGLTAPTQAQATPWIFIEESLYKASRINETFNVTVRIANVEASQKVIGVQFRVTYDQNLLEALSVVEGPFMQQFNSTAQPPYTYFMSFIEVDPLYGSNVLVGILLLPDENGIWTNFPQGSGALATITFKAIYRPIEPATATCPLNLEDTMIMNEDLEEVPHLTFGSTYKALPIPKPTLTIKPSSYVASLIGEVFQVEVDITLDSDLILEGQKLTGVQFRVTYDQNLLEALSVVEGPFMQQFNSTAQPPYTYFMSFIEVDPLYGSNVLVGILLLPDENGVWTNFPQGSGALATITFKAIKQAGIPQPPITSMLVLDDILLTNDELGEIPYHAINGQYKMEALSFTYEPSIPLAGQPVFFMAPEASYPVKYSWDFGDGTSFNVTESTVGHIYVMPGEYTIALICITDGFTSSAATRTITVLPAQPIIDIKIDVGSIHFNGEIAEFNALITSNGEVVDPTKIEALLYHAGSLYDDLTTLVQPVTTGLYIIPYTIPVDAPAGTYTIFVKAEYYNAKGAGMKSFEISLMLTSWGNSITKIENETATISNGLAEVRMNLTAINAKLVNIEGNLATISTTLGAIEVKLDVIDAKIVAVNQTVATISTTLGAINVKLDAIDAKIVAVNETVATISTTLGEANVKLGDVQSIATTALYATSILSAIAVILAAAILIFIRKK
jgi:PKD repeat protein